MKTTSALGAIVQAADAAAAASGVSVVLACDISEIVEVQEFASMLWYGVRGDGTLVSQELLRALSYSGGYVSLARSGHKIVGAAVGFLGAAASLHSHLVGVHEEWQGIGVGTALKLHQRAWAAAHGLGAVTWTFDPLVRRNAHVNLHRLGARVTDFVVDFYGEMPDARNSGQGSDRMMVRWDVEGPLAPVSRYRSSGRLLVDGDGFSRARTVSGEEARIAIPDDIERVRSSSPEEGRRWRLAVREALLDARESGLVVAGLTDAGEYLLVPADGLPRPRSVDL